MLLVYVRTSWYVLKEGMQSKHAVQTYIAFISRPDSNEKKDTIIHSSYRYVTSGQRGRPSDITDSDRSRLREKIRNTENKGSCRG